MSRSVAWDTEPRDQLNRRCNFAYGVRKKNGKYLQDLYGGVYNISETLTTWRNYITFTDKKTQIPQNCCQLSPSGST